MKDIKRENIMLVKRLMAISIVILLSVWWKADVTMAMNINNSNICKEEKKSAKRIVPGNPERPVTASAEWKGDYIYYGEKGGKSIKWRVLNNDGKNLLIMTEDPMGDLPYWHVDKELTEDFTWENSSLREWLNNTFFEQVFSESEKKDLLRYLQMALQKAIHMNYMQVIV